MTDFPSATHLDVDVEVRYWEDGTINGVVDSDGLLVPGRVGDDLRFRLEIATGRIEDWPEGMTAKFEYKICDAGLYWLSDADGKRLARKRGHYVPSSFLCHGRSKDGDYIDINIGPDGHIVGYRNPGIQDEQWEAISLE